MINEILKKDQNRLLIESSIIVKRKKYQDLNLLYHHLFQNKLQKTLILKLLNIIKKIHRWQQS